VKKVSGLFSVQKGPVPENGGPEKSPDTFLRVVFADEQVVVVNKPAGVPSVPARSRLDPPSVVERLAAEWGALEAVHRLDRDTCGLLVFARTPVARAALGRAFESRLVRKRYLAIVHGGLPRVEGIVHQPLADDPTAPPRKRVDPLIGRRATSRWRRLAVATDATGTTSLLALEPVTGRSHQLRAHLAWLGVPIVGDRLYARGGHGGAASGGPLALCGVAIDFPHPHDGRRIALVATVPATAPWTRFDAECYAVGSSADPLTCDQ
jgi:tRNA pseudouridine32 synthase/23S rRNA pseudouridine746 synthase